MRFLLFLLLFLNIAFSKGVPSNPAHRFTDEEKILLLLSEFEQRFNEKDMGILHLFSRDYKDEQGIEYEELGEIFGDFFSKYKGQAPIIYFENPKIEGEEKERKVETRVWIIKGTKGVHQDIQIQVKKIENNWCIIDAGEFMRNIIGKGKKLQIREKTKKESHEQK